VLGGILIVAIIAFLLRVQVGFRRYNATDPTP
jgi:hypothetical protein